MNNENLYLKIRRNQLGLTQQEVADLSEIQLKEYQRIEMDGVEKDMFQRNFMIPLPALSPGIENFIYKTYTVCASVTPARTALEMRHPCQLVL